MTITSIVLSVLSLAAANLQAAEPTTPPSLAPVGVNVPVQLVVDCPHEHVPGLGAVGELLATNNASKIFSGRGRLMQTGHRDCLRGERRVVFVRDPDARDSRGALIG